MDAGRVGPVTNERTPGFGDFAWAGFAVLFGLLSVAGLVIRLVRTIAGEVPVGVGVLGLVVGGLVAFWITVGAWRRTIWGRP